MKKLRIRPYRDPNPDFLYHRKPDGLLVHHSGYLATFGACDGCDKERYLEPGCCAAQDKEVNTVCSECIQRRIGTGFNSGMTIPEYRRRDALIDMVHATEELGLY